MFTTLRRISKSGYQGFWRNFTVSLSAIIIIAISLLAFISIYLVSQMLNASIAQLEEKVDVNVYFTTTASTTQILEVRAQLEALEEVRTIEYITREQALENFTKRNEGNEIVLKSLEVLDNNPLGASFNVRAQEISQYATIADTLDRIQVQDQYEGLIDRVNYNQNREAIEKINTLIDWSRTIGLIIAGVLAALAIIIVYNTIRLTIYTVREELAVMRLVGASKFFARGPFIVEGILYGIVGTIFSLVILIPLLYYIAPTLQEIFILNVYQAFVDNAVVLVLTMFAIGIVLGLISSALAIRRYLRI